MRSLRQRLLWTLLTWLALVLTVFSVAVFLVVRDWLRGDLDQLLRDKAFLLGSQVNPGNRTAVGGDDRVWRSDRYLTFGQTHDNDWSLLYKSVRLAEPIPISDEVKRVARHAIGMAAHDAVGTDGTRYRMATVRIDRFGKFLCYAQIAVKIEERDAPLKVLLLWLTGGSIGALVVAGLGLAYLIQQWGAPLAALSDSANKLNLGTLGRQRLFAPADAPELAKLADSFNNLLDRVEAAHASQFRFVADASHELRTPLTILRGEIEVALRRPRSPEEYAEVLQSSREEIERLSRLTENLLTLARADAGDSLVRRESVDLTEIAREVCRKLVPLSEQRNVSLDCAAVAPARVSGDSVALEQIFLNLIENALRYTPSGESAQVAVAARDGEVVVEVADHGSGIAPEHLPHLFERFYRVDKARSREFGGVGLGLSIVKTLVEAHGGSIEVRSGVGKGSTFTVRLPGSSRSH